MACGIFNSGSTTGSALSLPLVSALILAVGWRGAFIVTGLLGIGTHQSAQADGSGATPASIAGDFNGDGKIDLAVANYGPPQGGGGSVSDGHDSSTVPALVRRGNGDIERPAGAVSPPSLHAGRRRRQEWPAEVAQVIHVDVVAGVVADGSSWGWPHATATTPSPRPGHPRGRGSRPPIPWTSGRRGRCRSPRSTSAAPSALASRWRICITWLRRVRLPSNGGGTSAPV